MCFPCSCICNCIGYVVITKRFVCDPVVLELLLKLEHTTSRCVTCIKGCVPTSSVMLSPAPSVAPKHPKLAAERASQRPINCERSTNEKVVYHFSISRTFVNQCFLADCCIPDATACMKHASLCSLTARVYCCGVPQDIFRRYPNQYESIIATLCENLESLDEPEAKVSITFG